MVDRRAVLASLGTAVLPATAGCSVFASESADIRFEELVLGNGTRSSIDVGVLVYESDEIRYWREHSIGPKDEQNRAGELVISEPWIQEPASYELLVRYGEDVFRTDSATALDRKSNSTDENRFSALFLVTESGVASLSWRVES